jgi:hypothetical protein
MTIERGAATAFDVVKIRTSRYALIQPFVMTGLFLMIATFDGIGFELGLARVGLVMVGAVGATALWNLTLGVDLTPETVNLRGFRRRSISWEQVQAVIRHEELGQRTVRLILENGKTVRLRAPISVWGMGRPAYEQNFHRIGQWWLSHRGESWRPQVPEAPRNPYSLPDTR